VTYFDARYATPTVALMRQYAAVMTWVNYPLLAPVVMGNNLAQYVDMGGTAILGQWCFPTAGKLPGWAHHDRGLLPGGLGRGWGSGSYTLARAQIA